MSNSITENLEVILQRRSEKNNDSLNDALQKMLANSELMMQRILVKNNEMFEKMQTQQIESSTQH